MLISTKNGLKKIFGEVIESAQRRSIGQKLGIPTMGHICKCKQLFWTVPNSFFDKL